MKAKSKHHVRVIVTTPGGHVIDRYSEYYRSWWTARLACLLGPGRKYIGRFHWDE